MLIIDNKKDYYDHISSIYGVDKKIVYKRHSQSLSKLSFPCVLNNAYFFLEICNTWYILRVDVHPLKVGVRNTFSSFQYENIADISLVCQRDIEDKDKLGDVATLVAIQNQFSVYHRFPSYIVKHVIDHGAGDENIDYDDMFRVMFSTQTPTEITGMTGVLRRHEFINHYRIDDPLLRDLNFGKFIPPEEMFVKIQNYISSKIKDGVETNMSDEQKLESHGFSKKRSFRPKMK